MNVDALTCKVVLIGESGVGKTSIITRFTKDSFQSNFKTTVGASYCTKSIKFEDYKKIIKFEIWDTAGQERYRSLTKIFYKVIMVYDITREESFKELKRFWYKQIKEFGNPSAILAIAGNKSDEFENEKVSEKEGKEFANEIGAVFRNTSAKNGNGIEDLFNTIGGLMIDPNFEKNNIERKSFAIDNRKHSFMNLETQQEKSSGSRCCR